jgi:hypothetical protein
MERTRSHQATVPPEWPAEWATEWATEWLSWAMAPASSSRTILSIRHCTEESES